MTLISQYTEILYPYALDEKGSPVHIRHANNYDNYYCPNCRGEMIPRQGNIYTWHFAHKNASVECNNETALHVMGKILFRQQFDEGILPTIYYRCAYCKGLQLYSLSDCNRVNIDAEQIEINNSNYIRSLKPDVIFYANDKIKAVLEVVVTNPITSYKYAIYHDSGIPVMVWEPTWEILNGNLSKIYLSRTINISKSRCPKCEMTGAAIKIGNSYV
jgi:hypothetical protein